MFILRKKIFCFIIPLFLLVISLINPFFVSSQSKNYLLNCVGRDIIKVSSDGSVIYDGSTLLPETSPVAVTVREMILQYEQGSAEDKQRMLSNISTAFNTTCTISEEPGMTLATTPPLKFKPEVGFPGFTATTTVDGSLLGSFISSLFKYLLYASSVFAVIMVSVAGFKWVSAGGNTSKISEAKNKMITSLIGLFLCFSSVLILQTINTDLINFRPITIEGIAPVEFINRYDYQSNQNLRVGPGNSHLFAPEVIAGIKQWSQMSGIDMCIFYAIIHQESGGENPSRIGDDSGVARCDIIARRGHICNLYPNCCPNFMRGSTNRTQEACSTTICKQYVENPGIPGVGRTNWTATIQKRGYTFGIGLGQVTVFNPGSVFCSGGFKYAGKCRSYSGLLTVDGGLAAMVDAWSSYNTGGSLLTAFANYADGGSGSDWGRETAPAKMARYEACKRQGFESIASQGITQ